MLNPKAPEGAKIFDYVELVGPKDQAVIDEAKIIAAECWRETKATGKMYTRVLPEKDGYWGFAWSDKPFPA